MIADISPHRTLGPIPQDVSIQMGPMTGMGGTVEMSLRPVSEQRLPQELVDMIREERKQGRGVWPATGRR